jgi:hypothetical protein
MRMTTGNALSALIVKCKKLPPQPHANAKADFRSHKVAEPAGCCGSSATTLNNGDVGPATLVLCWSKVALFAMFLPALVLLNLNVNITKLFSLYPHDSHAIH